MQKNFKFPRQNFFEESSLVVTASTGKEATNVDSTTLHSTFKLPVKQVGAYVREKFSDDHLQILRKRYQYLKAVLIDEVSMTDNGTFDCLNRWLRAISKRNDF